MKYVLTTTALTLFILGWASQASAKTSCEDVKARIEAKIQGKGVKAFTLSIVPKDEKTELRVVGTCDGGAKKIIYQRG